MAALPYSVYLNAPSLTSKWGYARTLLGRCWTYVEAYDLRVSAQRVYPDDQIEIVWNT